MLSRVIIHLVIELVSPKSGRNLIVYIHIAFSTKFMSITKY